MPWNPPIIIYGGMYEGRKCPDGDLTGFFSFMENVSTQGGGVFGSKQSGTSTSWSGKFGMQSDLVTQYWRNHLDGQIHEFILAEVEIKNPEGAQYYKQTVVYTVRCKANAAVHRSRTIAGVTYEADTSDVEFGIINVKRYEYATPYSIPTSTQICTGFRGFTARYKLSGDDQAYTSGNALYRDNDFIIPLGFGTYNNKLYHICGTYCNTPNTTGYLEGVSVEYWEEHWGPMEEEKKEDPNEDPNNPGDEEEGGDGDHNRPVDEIPFPDLPYTGAANAGFITLYKLGPAEMWVFAQSFFTDTLLEILRDFFGSPMDIFVGLSLVPYVPDGNEMWYPLVGGVYVSRQALTKVSSQYKVLDFGSLHIEPYGKNVYDYEPYTKILIWLPYIGYRELPVDEIMGKNVHVKYYCDCLSGDCIAMISTQVMPQGLQPPKDVIIAQYNGSIASPVPVASESYDNLVSNVINAAIGGIGNMSATAFRSGDGNGGIAAAGVGALMSSVAGFVNGMKPTHKRDGTAGGTAGFLSIQYPYIIRHIPNQSLPSNYATIMGYPSNIGGKLGDGFSGFAAVEDIQLNNIPAMEPEREEIMELLREGVII